MNSLSELGQLSVAEVALLDAQKLMQLVNASKQALEKAKEDKAKVDAALDYKFQDEVSEMLQSLQQDTGTVNFGRSGIRIKATVPKKVSWDQEQLKTLAKRFADSGADPTEYLDISYKVPEKKYTEWPETIKQSFRPARTLTPGKVSYTLTPFEKD